MRIKSAILAGILLLPASAFCQVSGVIGVKFGFTAGSGYATADDLAPTDAAGILVDGALAVTNWNNLLIANASSLSTTINVAWPIAQDSAGHALSGVTLTPAGFNDGWLSGGNDCANARLLEAFWKLNLSDANAGVGVDGGGNTYVTLTFSGLPASTYDVYVYVNDNNGNYWGNIQANSVFALGTTLDNAGFNGDDSDPCTLTPQLHTATGYGNPVNYMEMPGIATTAGGVITITVASQGGNDFGVPGIELVPTGTVINTGPPIVAAPTEAPSTANVGVVAGQSVTLSDSAFGSTPISYKWQTDGGSGNAPTNIPGATSTNLVVNTTGLAGGTYVYDIVAANSLGTNTGATINIVVVPALTAQPAISVQFEGNGQGSETLSSGQVAGYVPEQFWNVDDMGSGGTATNLVDSTDAPTIATVNVTYDANQYGSSDNESTPDGILMSGGFWSGDGYVVNVTGVSYPTYNVIVYMFNDDNPYRRYGLTLGTQSYWGAVFNGNGYTVPPYTLDTQTTELPEGTQMQADVVEFTNLTGANFTINGQSPDGNIAMMGIQIINSVPSGPPVTAMPVIAPTNTPIYAGTQVTLAETASGQAPLYYHWRTDGGSGGARTDISGATNFNLTINTGGLPAGTYKYDVVVTNTSGASTSAVAILHLVAANLPVLVSDITPASAVVYAGEEQTFSAVFNGTMPITYQWQGETGHGFTNIPNATNASLTLANLQTANSGSYKVLAYNSVGGPVDSSAAALTVLASPTSVSAVLAANPVGYWRLNETANTSSGTVVALDMKGSYNGVYGSSTGDDIPGPTPSLGFPGFESANTAAEFTNGDPNSYVTLPALNLNTNAVTITTWIYPVGTPAPYSGIVFCRDNNSGDASGFCFTEGGQIGYTWNQNNGDTYNWMSGLVPPQSQWSFIALVVSPSNAIAYLCDADGQVSATNPVAENAEAFTANTAIGGDPDADGGNGSRTFNGVMDEVAIFNYSLTPAQVLNLYFSAAGGAPHVGPATASPSNTVFAGTTVTLNASVLGLEPFSYQWQYNGSNMTGTTNASLVLTDAQVPNSGSYDLVAGNSSGTNQSSALVLTVNPAGGPVFTQQPSPSSATNYVSGLVTFTAKVDGSPPIYLQWKHNGAIITNATSASLTLAGLQAPEAGTYTLFASNYLGVTNSSPATLTVLPVPNPSALNVLTYHNDNTRQGANTNEVLLTPANVNVNNFGRLLSYAVDGYVYAEPLYVSGLVVPGIGTVNAVFVATEHNSIYAFNADSKAGTNGGLLWHTNLGPSSLSDNHEFGDRYNGNNYTDIVPEVGITGTPVISLANGTLYVDVRTRIVTTTTNYFNSVHALNITNGLDQPYSPVVVTNSVPGKGVDNVGGVVTFSPLQENQRPGLTLAGGMLYVAFGSFADTDPYHGWVIGFNATNLHASAKYVFNTSPNASVANFGGNAGEDALWMGGNGLSVDANTNLYFEVANGSFSANTNGGDYGDSFVKLSTSNGLAVADYFTPYNQSDLAAGDADLGSGGPLLLPDSVGSAAHPHLILGAGKEGTIHLVDRDNMGHFNAANDSQIVQELGGAIGSAFSSPAYFNYQIYYQGVGDVTKGFFVSNAVINPTPVSQARTAFNALGGTPSVSANGTNNGIVWTIQSDAFGSGGPAVLHAYNATNLAQELWNSSQNLARDNPGGAIQMTTPTIVNGKVFIGTQYGLSVFGNGLFLATPTISPNGGLFTNSATVTLADTSPNSSIYYTLDGTAPTTNSILYTGPFVLKVSTLVQAIAAEFGAVNSGMASAAFVDNSATGSGTGLAGEYWAATSSKAFTNSTFSALPTLTRTDADVNFNWSVTGPSGAVGQTDFTARWTGCVQPQYSETYTLTTLVDDGVRLWINGQLLINAWTTNSSTISNGATITLEAQQLYNIQMDYFQSTGNAVAALLWSSPSTPQAVIPQTQLYPYSNPPPSVTLTGPSNSATYTASASVSLTADAAAQSNTLNGVSFYLGSTLLGTVGNAPYSLTTTGLAAGSYTLTAVAVDGSGLSTTSAPVNITVNPASGLPYGLTNYSSAPAFYNMPATYTSGTIPTLLSETGVFSDTPNMVPFASLIPYAPIVQLFSDNAQKVRYFSIPNAGAPLTPSEQIAYAPTNTWSFPAGTVFVKTFELVTNTSDPNSLLRLETRLLVRDTNGAVYGVTYKWRSDYSDADLLSTSQTQAVPIQTTNGIYTNLWYYPSPSDCLQCHTPVANYVLGVNARQLNGNMTYSNGVTDNQLRALNRTGLLYPAINEAQITNIEQLASLTNLSASYVQRARSYLDANCAQCHQPGGTGPTFDARYDTPLASQNIINTPAVKGNLGYDNVDIVTPDDVWRSSIYDRMNEVAPTTQMPPLARNLIDTNAVQIMADWINSLPGTPALAPPVLTPSAGIFTNSVELTLQPPTTNAAIYYTLNGSLPTTNSALYVGPIVLSNGATISANAWEPGYINSVAVSGLFTIVPPLNNFFEPGFSTNGSFQAQYWAPPGQTYVLQVSTDLLHWNPVSTNTPSSAPFGWTDPGATNAPVRFYRVVTQ